MFVNWVTLTFLEVFSSFCVDLLKINLTMSYSISAINLEEKKGQYIIAT